MQLMNDLPLVSSNNDVATGIDWKDQASNTEAPSPDSHTLRKRGTVMVNQHAILRVDVELHCSGGDNQNTIQEEEEGHTFPREFPTRVLATVGGLPSVQDNTAATVLPPFTLNKTVPLYWSKVPLMEATPKHATGGNTSHQRDPVDAAVGRGRVSFLVPLRQDLLTVQLLEEMHNHSMTRTTGHSILTRGLVSLISETVNPVAGGTTITSHHGRQHNPLVKLRLTAKTTSCRSKPSNHERGSIRTNLMKISLRQETWLTLRLFSQSAVVLIGMLVLVVVLRRWLRIRRLSRADWDLPTMEVDENRVECKGVSTKAFLVIDDDDDDEDDDDDDDDYDDDIDRHDAVQHDKNIEADKSLPIQDDHENVKPDHVGENQENNENDEEFIHQDFCGWHRDEPSNEPSLNGSDETEQKSRISVTASMMLTTRASTPTPVATPIPNRVCEVDYCPPRLFGVPHRTTNHQMYPATVPVNENIPNPPPIQRISIDPSLYNFTIPNGTGCLTLPDVPGEANPMNTTQVQTSKDTVGDCVGREGDQEGDATASEDAVEVRMMMLNCDIWFPAFPLSCMLTSTCVHCPVIPASGQDGYPYCQSRRSNNKR